MSCLNSNAVTSTSFLYAARATRDRHLDAFHASHAILIEFTYGCLLGQRTRFCFDSLQLHDTHSHAPHASYTPRTTCPGLTLGAHSSPQSNSAITTCLASLECSYPQNPPGPHTPLASTPRRPFTGLAQTSCQDRASTPLTRPISRHAAHSALIQTFHVIMISQHYPQARRTTLRQPLRTFLDTSPCLGALSCSVRLTPDSGFLSEKRISDSHSVEWTVTVHTGAHGHPQ